MLFDPLSLMLTMPAMLLALIATIITRSTFSRYSRVAARSGLTGAEAAQRLLRDQGVCDVRIEETHGFLSDHYDPMSKALRLSPSVYRSSSLAAIGVACHEAGHALQHARAYGPLVLRTSLVPAAAIGNHLAYFLFFIGMFFHLVPMLKAAVLVFLLAVLFSLVTLPVEWNASARAKALMTSAGIVTHEERDDAARVLNAAFLTYVAAAVMALMQLLYFLIRSGLLGGRRSD
jgi:Zn-dependent membrane protease YugP